MKLYILLSILLLPGLSMACLNKEAVTLGDGYELYQDEDGDIIPLGHVFMIEDDSGDTNPLYHVSARLKRLNDLWKQTGDISYRSDYGLVLIVAGRYQEAIDVFLAIERAQPGRYSTAANVGTAY